MRCSDHLRGECHGEGLDGVDERGVAPDRRRPVRHVDVGESAGELLEQDPDLKPSEVDPHADVWPDAERQRKRPERRVLKIATEEAGPEDLIITIGEIERDGPLPIPLPAVAGVSGLARVIGLA